MESRQTDRQSRGCPCDSVTVVNEWSATASNAENAWAGDHGAWLGDRSRHGINDTSGHESLTKMAAVVTI